MTSHDDIPDGAPVGRDGMSPAPTARRTSNAFGSPGTDSTVKRLDLNDAFIKHPDATFIVRAAGDAMQGAGIDDGDILLVDRSLSASHGSVVIAVVEGDLMCRRLEKKGAAHAGNVGHRMHLAAADGMTVAIDVTPETPLEVWGVVTTIIKTLPV